MNLIFATALIAAVFAFLAWMRTTSIEKKVDEINTRIRYLKCNTDVFKRRN